MSRRRRSLAILVALCAVALGACDAPTDVPESSAAPGDRTTSPPGVGSPSTTRRTSTGSGANDAEREATTTVAPATTDPPVATTRSDDPASRGFGPAGSYARTLLRAAPAERIEIELVGQGGVSLRARTVSALEDTLHDVTGKSISVSARAVDDDRAPSSWDEAAVVEFADRHAATAASSSVAVLHVLALPGRFGPDEDAIGVAARGNVFAIFVERVRDSATPLVPASVIEEAVTIHEAGHLLGLVDLVIDRDRDDPEHPHHSRNRNSVMYWAIETGLVAQVLGGPPPREFDGDDLADLAAIRGGA